MLGIEEIGSYVPQGRISNLEQADKFELDAHFIESKIGVMERAIKAPEEDTSDLALKALDVLLGKASIKADDIDVLIIVTQNPDNNIPHVSGVVHAKANLPENCATFDISLGCSGYVYGLQIIASFMSASGFKNGVLITADPYSKIVDKDDKNTALLFADAATATLISGNPKYVCDSFAFGSKGDVNRSLICENGVLEMNGRDIFNFASVSVPKIVDRSLDMAELTLDDVDAFLFHQGSGYILDALGRRMRLDPKKVVKGLAHVGNTVSSSIPLLLESEITGGNREKLVLCGFGVGLSYASCICRRVDQ